MSIPSGASTGMILRLKAHKFHEMRDIHEN